MAHPYNFRRMTKAAIIAELCEHAMRYGGLAWNIKVYNADWTGHGGGHEHPERVTAALDELWESTLQASEWLVNDAYEGAVRMFLDGEYTSYPGDDQGDWTFSQEGRSGGWLVLTGWRGHNLMGMYSDLKEWLRDELTWAELRAFHRGIVCLDHDLRNPSRAVSYEVNYLRGRWESDLADARTDTLESLNIMPAYL